MLNGFLKSVEKFPDHTAIIVNGNSFSYKWLYEKALTIAGSLIKKEGSGHSMVGLYTDNNEYTYAGIIGILLSKKAFVPLNHKFPDERLKKIIEDAGIKTILHCESSAKRVEALLPHSSVKSDTLTKIGFSDKIAAHPDLVVYILFTSGSTGVPKGIPISNKNFRALINALDKRYSLNENDRVLQAFELSFDVSLACTFIAWEYGSTLIIPDMEGIMAVSSFKAIHEHKATFVTIPPSAIFYLKKLKMLGSIKIPSVHTTLFTGEALPYKLAQEWKTSAENTIIENAYGPTETTVWCLFYKFDETTESQTINGLSPIGETLEGIRRMIVNEQGDSLKQGERGELLVEGDQIFLGYWHNEQKTKEVFYKDEEGKQWYRTGDIVVENKEGNVIYINRKDNQVQVNGFRVELGEVEHAVKKASGHEGVVVLAKADENYTDLYAFIEGDFVQEQLQERLKETLPFYMVPRNFVKVNPLPVNTNGKIDKQKLHQLYLS